MELMSAGKNSNHLPALEVAHTNHTNSLLGVGALNRISEKNDVMELDEFNRRIAQCVWLDKMEIQDIRI